MRVPRKHPLGDGVSDSRHRTAAAISEDTRALLLTLLTPTNLPATLPILDLLLNLAPGLMGCAHAPSPAEAPKTSAAVKEATIELLSQLPEAYQPDVVRLLQHAMLQAPERAALRTALADAVSHLALGFSEAAQPLWLHFVALLALSGNPSTRLLALQVLAPMLQDRMRAAQVRPLRSWLPLLLALWHAPRLSTTSS